MSATTEQNRIPLLDVLRGFALLGILLVNIIGFGMPSSAYLNPIMGIGSALDGIVWAAVDVLLMAN